MASNAPGVRLTVVSAFASVFGPTLTTQALYELYRRVTGEDRRQPTYLV